MGNLLLVENPWGFGAFAILCEPGRPSVLRVYRSFCRIGLSPNLDFLPLSSTCQPQVLGLEQCFSPPLQPINKNQKEGSRKQIHAGGNSPRKTPAVATAVRRAGSFAELGGSEVRIARSPRHHRCSFQAAWILSNRPGYWSGGAWMTKSRSFSPTIEI